MLYVELPPRTDTGWHLHPVQGYGYVISGTLTLQTKEKRWKFIQGKLSLKRRT